MIWLALALFGLAVWNFFVGMGLMAAILLFLAIWLTGEFLLDTGY
jgi:hypothetical protein